MKQHLRNRHNRNQFLESEVKCMYPYFRSAYLANSITFISMYTITKNSISTSH